MPDVGIVLLGAERAHLAVRDLAARGTAAAIVLASGYTETGEDGARRQKEAHGSRRARCASWVPNTIGLVNLTDNIVLSATGALEMDHFPIGSIGVVSQSGGILGALLSRAAARGIGLSKLISTSNEVDLELADFIDHLADDDATKVIALYIETVRNPAKFRAAALKAARAGKPVVAFKIGRSEAGAKAAVSHTGALAGADRMYDALFKQIGVIRAQTFGDLLDIPVALVHRPRAARQPRRDPHVHRRRRHARVRQPRRRRLRYAGARCGDRGGAARAANRRVTPHSTATRSTSRWPACNPTCLRGAIKTLLASPSYDALTIIVGSSGLAMPELMAGRHPGLPAAVRQAGDRLRQPARAGDRRLADAARRAGVRGRRELHRGAGRNAAGEPVAGARRGEAPIAKVAVDDFPAGSLDEAQAKAALRPLRRALCARGHRFDTRPRPSELLETSAAGSS